MAIVVGIREVLALVGLLFVDVSVAIWAILVFAPYVAMAFANGWVLAQRGRTRLWLLLYVFMNWYGFVVPLFIALFLKPSQQPVDDHVRSLGA